FDRELGLALVPYGVLTVGLLLCSGLAALWPHPVTLLLTSPPVWLAAACIAAAIRMAGRGPGTAVTVRQGIRSWVPVGVSTAAFMIMGWALSVFDMSTRIGEALSGLGVWTVPALGMLGSVLAGSITGSLSMFATTFGSIAAITGSPELPVVAAGMAASGLANGASPARAALALAVAVTALPAGDGAAEEPLTSAQRRSAESAVLRWVVVLSGVSAAGVALALTLTV